MNRGQACGYEYISIIVCSSHIHYLHAIALVHRRNQVDNHADLPYNF